MFINDISDDISSELSIYTGDATIYFCLHDEFVPFDKEKLAGDLKMTYNFLLNGSQRGFFF